MTPNRPAGAPSRRRFAWALLALVQLAVGVLAPTADAHHGVESGVETVAHPGAAAHHDCVGSPDHPCDPGHDHAECLLCRALANGALPVAVDRGVSAAEVARAHAAKAPARAPAPSGVSSPLLARPPPRA
jgi:hypothetical protein